MNISKNDTFANFENDNINYKNKINNLFNSNTLSSKDEEIIRMGKLPLVYNLYENNIINSDIYIHKSTINHFLQKHTYITSDIILKLYENIVNPLIIFNGSENNTILSILNIKSSDNYYFQTPIFLNYKDKNIYINAIGTLYHQDSLANYIGKEILKHNLIAYNKKIESYIHSIGLLLPVEENRYSIYDDSITFSLKNVKNNYDAIYYTFNTTHKFFKPIFRCSKNELINACNKLNISFENTFNSNTLIPYTNSDDYINNISNLHNILINNKIIQIQQFKDNLKNLNISDNNIEVKVLKDNILQDSKNNNINIENSNDGTENSGNSGNDGNSSK